MSMNAARMSVALPRSAIHYRQWRDEVKKQVSRRSILKAAGTAGVAGGLPGIAMAFQPAGPVAYEVAASDYQETAPKYSIRFAVIGIDHNHINGITDAL